MTGTTEALIASCRSNEQEAWRALFDAYFDSVYRWATCFGLDRATAEDVAQEVFAVAFRKLRDLDSGRAISAWLFQITRRKAANMRRLAWARRVFTGDGSEEKRDETRHDLPFDLVQTLSKMPPWAVEVLMLHDLDGRSRSEVAQMLGIAEGTAASRLANARDAFKRLWSGEESQ